MGRPKKNETDKVLRKTFSLYPTALLEFNKFKSSIEFDISDSALISYLIRQGIKRTLENPISSGNDAAHLI